MNTKLEKKIKKLEESIISAHKKDTELFAELDEAQRKLGVLSGDRPFCKFLEPYFFTRQKYNRLTHAAEAMAKIFETMTYAALENDEIFRELDLTEREEEMARIEPGYKTVSNSSRFDTYLQSDGFKFLEYNAETPAGIVDQMQIEKVLELIPEVQEFLEENKHWRPRPHEKLLEALVTDYREFGGRKEKPNIAIVDWKDILTSSEFGILRDYFESEGHKTIILDPLEAEYDGKVVRAGDFEIDIFYKRVVIHEFLERADDENAFIKAYKDGNIFMANSFRTKIPHKKSSFVVVSDPKFQSIFTSGQKEMIRRHIPWTRKLRDVKTEYKGKEIDLLEHLRREREDFILKPNDEYGGSGIKVGWDLSPGEWDTALENALKGSYVVQEKVPVEKVTLPIYSDEIRQEEFLIDFDPFLFRGKAEGGLVRISSQSLVNIARGGNETALIVIE